MIAALSASAQQFTSKNEVVYLLPPAQAKQGHADFHPNATPVHSGLAVHDETSNGINYYGGPVLLGTVNLYLIWYGNWANSGTPPILTDLASAIGGTPYYNILRTYYGVSHGAMQYIANSAHYAGTATDNYSQGTHLLASGEEGTGGIPTAIVQNAISNGTLPLDANGIYLLLPSSDVQVDGLGTQYCGYHQLVTIGSTNISMALIGDTPGCAFAAQTSPNNNLEADTMANIMVHEIAESITDPDPYIGWLDASHNEMGDKCAYNFGSTQTAPNGAPYNQAIGSRLYLLQQLWVNASGGYCGQSWQEGLFRVTGQPNAVFYSNGAQFCWIASPDDFTNDGFSWSAIVPVSSFPTGVQYSGTCAVPPFSAATGQLTGLFQVTGQPNLVYYSNGAHYCWIASPDDFTNDGFSWSAIVPVSSFPTGVQYSGTCAVPPFSAATGPIIGLFRVTGQPNLVYYSNGAHYCWIASPDDFTNDGFSWSAIVPVSSFPTGVQYSGTCTVPPSSQ